MHDASGLGGDSADVTSGLLDAIQNVLIACDKPLSAKAIATELERRSLSRLGGLTPWKTVGARLAVDIRSNPETRFMRVGRGLYALKTWSDLIPVSVPARRINPLDEDILVLDREVINRMKAGRRECPIFCVSSPAGHFSQSQLAETAKRSPNRTANCPMAAVHSIGRRQWMPAFWIAR